MSKCIDPKYSFDNDNAVSEAFSADKVLELYPQQGMNQIKINAKDILLVQMSSAFWFPLNKAGI